MWGLILGLLVVTAIEGRARLAYAQSFSRVQNALAESERAELATFKIDQVPALLSGQPQESHEQRDWDRVAHYRWNGLFKQYGMHVSYGSKTQIVTEVTTDDPPASQTPVPVPAGGPGFGTGSAAPAQDTSPAGGEGPARPRFDPLQADADGDGKLSRAEAPGRMADNFDAIDTNQDGFLDAAEIEARPRPQFGGRPGGPDGGGRAAEGGADRGRPPLEEPAATPAAETPVSEPAPAN